MSQKENRATVIAIIVTDTPLCNEKFPAPDAEEAVMSTCTSLIAIVDREGHRKVEFSHFSVKEYLTSERLAAAEEHLSYYHILPEYAHTILAHCPPLPRRRNRQRYHNPPSPCT